jgi:hypothetical protein
MVFVCALWFSIGFVVALRCAPHAARAEMVQEEK